MASTLRLKRFSNAAILKRIDPALLVRFLVPFREFLVGQRGMAWPHDPGDLDHGALARILMSPSVNTPEELLDALFFVDGLADADCFDRLLAEAQDAGIDLGDGDPTPEDLTLHVWLADREILERVHAEQYRVRPRVFQSFFATKSERPDLHFPDEDTRQALEADLNDWFDFKKKGRGTKVFAFAKDDGFWFLVRHGQRIKREGTVEADGDSGSVFYRPEKFDVLIYYPETGELAIYADTKGERQTYCLQFGKHLFGDVEFFDFRTVPQKYTLTPLIETGRDALACADVDGIERIRLYELHLEHNSEQKDLEIRRADSVLRALEDQQRDLDSEQAHTKLVRAKFRVTFVGGRERSVTIEPPNIASFDRETDNSMIHDWLTKRGFIATGNTEGHEDADPGPVLEVA